jgi:hypothetical protein
MEKDMLDGDNSKAIRSISIIRSLLNDNSFKNEHRTASKFFSRKYKLDFVTVVLLILQKSIKPLQLVLNEFFKKLDNGIMVNTELCFDPSTSAFKSHSVCNVKQKSCT